MPALALTALPRRLAQKYWRSTLSATARAVQDARLTYLSAAKLHVLECCLARVEADGIAGDCVEFGVALGGSGIVIARRMAPRRRFVGYDVFGTIPPPSARDGADAHERYRVIAGGRSAGIGGDPYYGYQEDLYNTVKANFAAFDVPVDGVCVRLVKGLFQDTVSFADGARVAFAHIDCDWHDPVALCLERTYARLASGGIVVLDDYNDYGGCRTAVQAFLVRRRDMRLLDASHSAVLVRG
jgi:asparagine synthase (glutamine-hydrolysing)